MGIVKFKNKWNISLPSSHSHYSTTSTDIWPKITKIWSLSFFEDFAYLVSEVSSHPNAKYRCLSAADAGDAVISWCGQMTACDVVTDIGVDVTTKPGQSAPRGVQSHITPSNSVQVRPVTANISLSTHQYHPEDRARGRVNRGNHKLCLFCTVYGKLYQLL